MKRFLFILFVISIACGKRGDPRPPVPVIPQPTTDLSVAQLATTIVVSWTYPSLTTAGRSLPAIRRIVVYRYTEELPPSATTQASSPAESSIPDAITQFAKIPTLTPDQFAKLSHRINSIEGANLSEATEGSRLSFEDMPQFRSTSGRPVRITYGVVTEGLGARSEFSNLVSVVPLDVATAPPALTATAKPEGIALAWTAPRTAATGAPDPIIVGYNIYRDTEGNLGNPINPTPIAGTSFTDVPPYGEHSYRVTAAASAGPPRVESEASAAVKATFTDLVPPPAPTNVSALVETRIARVVWDPVDVPDLAGYRVYRWEGTARIKLTLGPIRQTFFGDESVDPGITYHYSITAVDTSGNESPPGDSQPFLVPKTP